MNRRDALKATLGLAAVPLVGIVPATKTTELHYQGLRFVLNGIDVSSQINSQSIYTYYRLAAKGNWEVTAIECPE